VIFDTAATPGVFASDHFGLLAEFDLSGGADL
jgi:hypothetical protein